LLILFSSSSLFLFFLFFLFFRQEELEGLRGEVQKYATAVETIVRNQQSMGARTKQFEQDVRFFF
jgi:hypothetical protein